MNREVRLALTGFMGVGKSSVARHLEHMTGCGRIDLDTLVEEAAGKSIAEIIDAEGMARFREIEAATLAKVIESNPACILSLGGGTWTIEGNRRLIKESGFTSVWLESSFEHCWYNIKFSRKSRPLARDKDAARLLFDERQKVYCLADWHFLIKPGLTSYDVAAEIAEQVL
jgi:shikimate kinase